MRRITLWLMATITLIVLVFTYPTSTNRVASASTVPSATAVSTKDPTSPTSTGTNPFASTSSSSPASPSTQSSTAARSYTGTAVDTQYGPVQVRIMVSGGKITAADAVEYPANNGRDQEINSSAIPQLNAEAVAKQSATIDMVSGATYTSTGYLQSLQSALDQAKL